jgi:hypothetical protein
MRLIELTLGEPEESAPETKPEDPDGPEAEPREDETTT